jgi:hypothetical protein
LQDDSDTFPQGAGPAAGVAAQDRHAPGVALAVALEDLDRRRLARTVRPQQPEDLAALDVEVDPAHGLDAPVGLLQVSHLDGRHHL